MVVGVFSHRGERGDDVGDGGDSLLRSSEQCGR